MAALEQLVPLVFDELRSLARHHFRRERDDHTLRPTALVNEVYLRLAGQQAVRLENRAQFFAFASRLMRRILVDHHRAQRTAKRGQREARITLDEALLASEQREIDLLRLDDALTALGELDGRQARIVEMRFFGGLSVVETGAVLGVSPATVKREWSTAKAWLRRELGR